MATTFYQVPKALFTDPKYQGLSADAITLYSVLRDRYMLSLKNGNKWRDKVGVFIHFTREAMAKLLRKSVPTVRKLINQLITVGLLAEKRLGLTKANKLYVKLLSNESEEDIQSGKKQGFKPDRNGFSTNETKPNLYVNRERKTPEKAYQRGRQGLVLAQQYTQREYTREELNQLVKDI